MKKAGLMVIALLASSGVAVVNAQNPQADGFAGRKSDVEQQDLRTTPPANTGVTEPTPADPKSDGFSNRKSVGPDVDVRSNESLAPPETSPPPKGESGWKKSQNQYDRKD